MRTVSYRINLHQPVSQQLKKVYMSLAAHAGLHGRSFNERIHHLRVSVKKLRALWRLIHPIISDTTFAINDARLRMAGRRLGTLRDNFILNKTLKKIAATAGEKPFKKLHVSDLTNTHKQMQENDRLLRACRKKIQMSCHAFVRLKLEMHNEWLLVGPGLRITYRKTRAQMKTARNSALDKDYHSWRKFAKYLLYQLKLFEIIFGKNKKLQHMTEALGEVHDLVVLKSHLKRGQNEHYFEKRFIENMQCKHRNHALKIAKSLLAKKARKFETLLEHQWIRWKKS